MTELDAALVRRKLTRITTNLRDLEPLAVLDLASYRADRLRRKAVERLLHETIEAAVDACLHLVRAAGGPVPEDYFSTFVEAGRQGIIPEALAARLAPSTGLRNRLVHEYEAVDDAIVLRALPRALEDFRVFVTAVEEWLTNAGR